MGFLNDSIDIVGGVEQALEEAYGGYGIIYILLVTSSKKYWARSKFFTAKYTIPPR